MSAAQAPPAPDHWSVVVPVKRLAVAKSRLLGLARQTRAELALAFAADTVAAALASPVVVDVVVVTDEPVAARELGGSGATIVPDLPGAGLNAALRYGAGVARAARSVGGIAALASDLPALRAADLTLALISSTASLSFVPDAGGGGTTLLAARDVSAFTPSFGAGSAARHAAAGAVRLDLPVPSLRRDVDTTEDLADALALGVGAHTSAVVRRLGLARRPG
jgi:2-phospho-L-lactate/phosphoenolpyruvate guanylyltransferase